MLLFQSMGSGGGRRVNIYVASSWRNLKQPQVVAELRDAGHDVYDFRNPVKGNHGFHWSNIDPEWKQWTPITYRANLAHPIAVDGFGRDMRALVASDAVVAVQPFGRSTALELGWACGAGKRTILLLASGEPELMVKMVQFVCVSMKEVLQALGEIPR